MTFIIFVFFLALKEDKRYDTENFVGYEIDKFEIKYLENENTFSKKDLNNKKYNLINIWASWCIPCRQEHPLLLKLKENKEMRLIGINYKDKYSNAKSFLRELGNPYDISLSDQDGTKSIIFGVFGVPETFLINSENIIVKRFIGPINQNDLKLIVNIINEK